MADFALKANDLLPLFEATLGYEAPPAGAPTEVVNAYNAATAALVTALGDPATVVTFIMKKHGTVSAAKVNSDAEIVDATTRKVRYSWNLGDTDVAGSYDAEFEVIWPSGKPQTFPLMTYFTIDILADLDAGGA